MADNYSVPPSAGKTVAISTTVALACQNLLFVVTHDVWGLPWMTFDLAGDIMIVSGALAGWLMHTLQRDKERKAALINPQQNGAVA